MAANSDGAALTPAAIEKIRVLREQSPENDPKAINRALQLYEGLLADVEREELNPTPSA